MGADLAALRACASHDRRRPARAGRKFRAWSFAASANLLHTARIASKPTGAQRRELTRELKEKSVRLERQRYR